MVYTNELYHHGIKGQRWGVRRYRNEDGSLTPAGKKREAQLEKYRQSELQKVEKRYGRAEKAAADKQRKLEDKYMSSLAKSGGKVTSQQRDLAAEVLTAKLHKYEAAAKRVAETSALKNMTIDELEKDRRTVRQKSLGKAAALAAFGAVSVAAPIDPVFKAVGVASSLLAMPSVSRSAGYETRVSKARDEEIMKGAMKKAGVAYYSHGRREYKAD